MIHIDELHFYFCKAVHTVYNHPDFIDERMQKPSHWYTVALDREPYNRDRPHCLLECRTFPPGAILWVDTLNNTKLLSTGET